MELKIYVLDSKRISVDSSVEEMLKFVAEKRGYEAKVTTSGEKNVRHLPLGYDSYLLHLSDTSEEAISELKEEQPWSKIFGIFGIPGEFRPIPSLASLDHDLMLPDIEYIVNETIGIYLT